jgi:hypothetical protein
MTKHIHGHCVEPIFGTEPMNARNSDSSTKLAVNVKLVFQCLIFIVDRLQFNDNGLSRQKITSKVSFACVFMSIQESVARLS